MKYLFLTVVVLFLGLPACEKVDEQNTALSMEDKLCREWKLEKFLLNGYDLEIIDDFSTTTYKKDGLVELIFHDSVSGDITTKAQWRFNENNKFLEVSEFVNDDKGSPNNLPLIFKLMHLEYWIRYEIIKLTATEHILLLQQTQDRVFRFEYKAI